MLYLHQQSIVNDSLQSKGYMGHDYMGHGFGYFGGPGRQNRCSCRAELTRWRGGSQFEFRCSGCLERGLAVPCQFP